MRFYNVPNIIPTSTVLNTTVNSLPMQLMDAISFSIQIFFTGTSGYNGGQGGSGGGAGGAIFVEEYYQ